MDSTAELFEQTLSTEEDMKDAEDEVETDVDGSDGELDNDDSLRRFHFGAK